MTHLRPATSPTCSSYWAAKGMLMLFALLILALCLAPTQARAQGEIVFEGKFYASLQRIVVLPYAGTITELLVNSGETIKEGDIILSYELDPETRPQIQQILNPIPIIDLNLQIVTTQEKLNLMRRDYQEVNQLAQEHLASPNEVNRIGQQINSLERQLELLQHKLELLEQENEEQRSILVKLYGDEILQEPTPNVVSLRAPIDGQVLSIDPLVRENAEVPANIAALTIGVMDPLLLRAQLYESEVSQLELGDVAEVTVDSLPGQSFQAVLTRINWTPISLQLDQPSYYAIELTTANPDLVLKEGYKAQVTFPGTE